MRIIIVIIKTQNLHMIQNTIVIIIPKELQKALVKIENITLKDTQKIQHL